MTNFNKIFSLIENQGYDPKEGLPDSVFYFISRHTPLVNVDLLIKNELNQTLLTWRDDEHSGRGWHIPGGIVRFKEKINKRINEVAKSELCISLVQKFDFIDLNEIIVNKKKDRAHFISLLFQCYVDKKNLDILENKASKNKSKFSFFQNPPPDLLKYHEIYKKFF